MEQVTSSYNLFIDSSQGHNSQSKGDDYLVNLQDSGVHAGDGEFIRMSLSNFSMAKNFQNVNDNNNEFEVQFIPVNAESLITELKLDNRNYATVTDLATNFATKIGDFLVTNRPPVSGFTITGMESISKDNIITFIITTTGLHGLVQNNVTNKIRFLSDISDSYMLLGGNRMSPAPDLSKASAGSSVTVSDNMVASMIASKGFIEIPFKQYFSFSNTHTGSSRFTVATQSLDRIYWAWRESTYSTLDAPHAIPGYSTAAGTAAGALTPVVLSDYGGAHGTGAVEKYITNYQKFTEPGAEGALKYQLQLNGAMYPQFSAGMEDMYQITKNSLPGPVKYGITKEQLRDSYFVQCVRLNMPDSEMSRTLSGLDTRSVSLNGYINTTGTLTADANLMIFAECTSSLRVGAGRQLEVVI